MRISETKVCQLVESEPPKLVIMDEDTQVEALLYKDDALALYRRNDTPTLNGAYGGTLTLTEDEMGWFRKAFDYFAPHL